MRSFICVPLLLGALLWPSVGRGQLPSDPRTTPNTSAAAADETTESGEVDPHSYYLDPARGPVAFQPEYELWFGDERRPARYGRAALELSGILAIGTTYYWIVQDPNKVDWDYVDLKDRALHTDVKFDNNMFRTNFLLHPLAGTMSYWLSRANGLDIYLALANSALSSAAFEFLLEWLEKPSINDLVVTPLGGVAGGEFFFHLGDYLNSALGRDNAFQRALAFSIGVPEAMHTAMDGITSAPPATADSLGYSSAYWHRFGVGYGISDAVNERGDRDTIYDLMFNAELVAMPGFSRPGQFSIDFHQGNFTEARLRTSVARGLLQDVDLWIGANLVGHYAQSYEGDSESLRGSASMVAASVDMRYADRWLLGRRDQFAVFHFLGPSAKAWFALGNGLTATAEARLHLDLAGIMSPAYKELAKEYGVVGTKSVLQLQDYYQGLGGSGKAAASIGWHGFELVGRASYGSYRSVDGLDRYYTPRDATNSDQIIELGADLKYSPPGAPISVRVAWDELEHRSQMAPVSLSFRDRRLGASAALRF